MITFVAEAMCCSVRCKSSHYHFTTLLRLTRLLLHPRPQPPGRPHPRPPHPRPRPPRPQTSPRRSSPCLAASSTLGSPSTWPRARRRWTWPLPRLLPQHLLPRLLPSPHPHPQQRPPPPQRAPPPPAPAPERVATKEQVVPKEAIGRSVPAAPVAVEVAAAAPAVRGCVFGLLPAARPCVSSSQ